MIRTLVLYETKYGSSEVVARRIASVLGPSKCLRIRDFKDVYKDFELVVVGGPIYADHFLPEIEGFLNEKEEWLRSRKLALFCVCLAGAVGKDYLGAYSSRFIKNLIWSESLGGRMDMAALDDKDRANIESMFHRLKIPPQGSDRMDLFKVMQAALEIKRIRDMVDSDLDENSRRQAVEGYLRSRNTCVLASHSQLGLRATPLEYRYRDGGMFILTEGGEKMAHIMLEPEVAVVVNDIYSGQSSLFGLQLRGRAKVISNRSQDFDKVLMDIGYDPSRLRRLPFDMNVIRVDLIEAELLSASLLKSGNTIRQRVSFNPSL